MLDNRVTKPKRVSSAEMKVAILAWREARLRVGFYSIEIPTDTVLYNIAFRLGKERTVKVKP